MYEPKLDERNSFKIEMGSLNQVHKEFYAIMRKAKRNASFYHVSWKGNNSLYVWNINKEFIGTLSFINGQFMEGIA